MDFHFFCGWAWRESNTVGVWWWPEESRLKEAELNGMKLKPKEWEEAKEGSQTLKGPLSGS